ncbi:hypothetical protein EV144_106361 [Flavobacterium sp. 270]|uniref:hypothetical protein n=1 Tax=Flavobacterium sp. 270 TaxID=2512114 RepID=UPI00106517FE|nr:hypothetical protein [Flavobacterium sp. 270]TDW46687.1 hypothetical protein EV144_106361 [Flavobacterium sp. 270]
METLLELNRFAKILTDKGYNEYFHTQGAYAGKLKESLSEFFESCQKGTDNLPKHDLLLTSYLQWSGDEKPRIECAMWVKHLNEELSLSRMEIIKKDQFGQILKKIELKDLSVISAPKLTEAIAMVSDEPKQQTGQSPKRFML